MVSAMARAAAVVRRVKTRLEDGTTVVVRGPAGIGKTTVVHRALGRRPHVLGQSLEPLGDLPYHPLVHAFGRVFGGMPVDVASDVAARLAGRTLVVEDAHWSDRSTLEVLALLANRVSLVVTTRTPLAIERSAGVVVVDVPPLESRAAHALAAKLHPTLDGPSRSRLVDLAAGNPLLIEQLVSGEVVSLTLADAVRARVAGVPPGILEQLATVALDGRPLPASLLDAVGAAAVAEAHGLVVDRPDGLAVSHALLADAVVALGGRRHSAGDSRPPRDDLR